VTEQVSTEAEVYLWDMARKKRALRANISALLGEKAAFSRARVLKSGMVAITLTNGYSYVFDTKMDVW
jgi:hypothetical protein